MNATTLKRVQYSTEVIARQINPADLGDTEVVHYSIPALQETGKPTAQPASEIASNKWSLEGGEVLVSKLNVHKNCVTIVERHGDIPLVSSTEFVPFVPTKIEPRYLKYLFQSEQTIQYLMSLSESATRSHARVNPSDIIKLKVRQPDLGAQEKIADYLDRETAHIDRLIAEKERMLALLEQKRAALISRLVTRGLDPNAPLKPSGQEWLGEIPKHWPTTKFSWDVFISEGQVDPEDDSFSEMILLAPNHIESRTGQIIYKETSADQGAISGKYLCQEGDVLYSKIRPALRKVALADEDCLCSADMYALRPSKRLLPQYLQYFLLSEDFSTWAELESARVAMPKINREALSAIRIPVPPLPEQEHIISEIRKGTEIINLQRKAISKSVELLKERRAALITAVVTGQIPLEEITG